ncbi:MAG: calcium-translocating P-type ATPase, SERCA-type [Clostridiales bacterium]|nr:calcium-translocating P-type ATPase, SERCA-type [Clostridiales bacterium]
MDPEQIAEDLDTGLNRGLTSGQVGERLEKFGSNDLVQKKGRSVILMFLAQFKDFMIILLLVAAVISFVASKFHDITEPVIILAIVILNAIIGVVQENKAEQSLTALKKISSPVAKVVRDGNNITIPSKDLVPGDIIVLETGDSIPADIRLIEAVNLKVQESALTGESAPVDKSTGNLAEKDRDIPLGDRINMAYSGCLVTYGRGSGIVVETGMNTQVGKIAGMLMSVKNEETPLQKKLNQLGKYLGIGAVIICVIVFLVGIINGKDTLTMFMTAVSLAVAAIPEGLPAIATIVLAIGVQKMVERHAIIRNLPSVETLGSTSIICSDKTGTLTQNRMTVVKLWRNGNFYDIDNMDKPLVISDLANLCLSGILCNDTKISKSESGIKTLGDPTETAIVDMGLKLGLDKRELDGEYKRVGEMPFDSGRKLMSVLCEYGNNFYSYTKGAVDVLLSKCNSLETENGVIPLTEELRESILSANHEMAGTALRVLGMAYKEYGEKPDGVDLESDLVFTGLMGMIDPPRPEVAEAVQKCFDAGIRPVMITGDHKTTAVAIARDLKILKEGDLAVEGSELDAISDGELVPFVKNVSVYARVSPEHKVRIVKAWKANGKIVAMTGDGVNDAPALKTADIGAAMGIVGTEVAKESADMVLTDDNFATIVAAVEEGRRIFDNIIKAVAFLISCNIGEIITLFLATMLIAYFPEEPLTPIHILWINLVTDSLPALALGVEPAGKNIMKRKPFPANASVFSGGLLPGIIYQGIFVGAITLCAYQIGYHTTGNYEIAQTMAFTTLAFSQLFHSFNCKSNKISIFKTGIANNPKLILAVIGSSLMMLLVLLVPFMRRVFGLAMLNGMQWLIVLGLSISIILLVEIVKLFTGRKEDVI